MVANRKTEMSPTVTASRDQLKQLITDAVAEVDLQQIAITRRLTPAERIQQMLSMIELVEGIAAFRLRQRRPELSEAEASRIVRSRDVDI